MRWAVWRCFAGRARSSCSQRSMMARKGSSTGRRRAVFSVYHGGPASWSALRIVRLGDAEIVG